MSIRFACEHCGRKLRVGPEKAGRRVKCPQCAQAITVPSPEAEKPPENQEPPPSEPPSQPPPPDPLDEFAIYDDAEWVYETEPSEQSHAGGEIDASRISVPRRVIYLQGALLLILAAVSFLLGALFGQSYSSDDAPAPAAEPGLLTGVVLYEDRTGAQVPDQGAVAMLLPQDERPDEEAPPQGLRPSDPPPTLDHDSIGKLRLIGGDYARADASGQFQLRAPTPGAYYLLVISNHAERDDDESHDPNDLAAIGRYFSPAYELLGGDRYRWKYRWREQTIRGDVETRVVFE